MKRLLLAAMAVLLLTPEPALARAPERAFARVPEPAPARAPALAVCVLPLDGPVTRGFEPPPKPWLPGHRGVDLGGSPGAMVGAACAGEVAFAGMVAGRPVLTIEHAGGLRTTYEPMVAMVGVGDAVSAGMPVGTLVAGHAGCPVGACLHWGLRRGETYLDPLSLLRRGRVRLLPLA